LRDLGVAKDADVHEEVKGKGEKDVAASLDVTTQKALALISKEEKEAEIPNNLRQKATSENSQSLITALTQNQN